MNRELESVLIWGSLGAGVALMTSGHPRAGFWVAMAAPATVAIAHPQATWKALRSTGKAVAKSGEAVCASGAAGGRAVWKSSKAVGKGWAVAGRGIARAMS